MPGNDPKERKWSFDGPTLWFTCCQVAGDRHRMSCTNPEPGYPYTYARPQKGEKATEATKDEEP